MLKELRLCEVLCIAGMLAGCDVGEVPVRDVGQAVTAPPPATGISPCTGWPGGLFGATAVYTHDMNTVSFHGGTWTVPVPAQAGQSLSDVSFTIEAPTGHVGDPTSVRVGLYSNGNALAFATLTPAGMSTPVPGSISLGGRVIASGEVLALEFAPLVTGGYAANDVKIDAIGISAVLYTRPVWPVISYGSALVEEAGDPFGTTPVRKFRAQGSLYAEIPFSDGETIVGFSIELAGNGSVDSNLAILYGTRSGGQLQIGALTDFRDIPASWGTYRTSSFTPTRLSGNGKLSMLLGANSPNLYWGHIWPVFSH